MREITLTTGQIALVDDEDFVFLSRHNWYHYFGGYARRIDGGKLVLMHRFIMNAPDDAEVDHINGNRLDNRRANLRIVTAAQNQWNRGRPANNTSGCKGVTKHKGRWVARIQYNGLRKHLGAFVSLEEAYEVYCLAADLAHGEYANHGKAVA